MTSQSRATLKAAFENGDVPTASNYDDVFDSFVNLSDTTIQSLSSPLEVTRIVAPEVSAGDVNVTGIVSTSALNVLGAVSAGSVVVDGVVSASSAVIAADLSAQSIGASAMTVTVSASIGALNCTSLRINTATTAAATIGSGEAVPASVAAYAVIDINGTSYRVALFEAD